MPVLETLFAHFPIADNLLWQEARRGDWVDTILGVSTSDLGKSGEENDLHRQAEAFPGASYAGASRHPLKAEGAVHASPQRV